MRCPMCTSERVMADGAGQGVCNACGFAWEGARPCLKCGQAMRARKCWSDGRGWLEWYCPACEKD
jgi:hypothetical protein